MAINFESIASLNTVKISADLKPGNYRAILTAFDMQVDQYGNFDKVVMEVKTSDGRIAKRTFKNLKQVSYLFTVQLRGQADELRYNDVSLLDCVKYASEHEFDFSIQDNEYASWQFMAQPEPLSDEEKSAAVAAILGAIK